MMRLIPRMLFALVVMCFGQSAFGQRGVFSPSESKYVVCLVVDMSGSFSGKMGEGGEGFKFVTGSIERYFRARVGTADRLIIGQISGNHETLVWEGLPLHLRKEFTKESFGRFLRANSDPNGSPVYESIVQSIEYVMDDPAVKSGQAKSAILIASDMRETSPEATDMEKRLTAALAAYGRLGGVVGIYYCNQRLVPEWRRRLKEAGIRESLVQSAIVGRPAFPKFED